MVDVGVLSFKKGSHHTDQDGLNLVILLPQSLKCWNYRHAQCCLHCFFSLLTKKDSNLYIIHLKAAVQPILLCVYSKPSLNVINQAFNVFNRYHKDL